MLKRMLAQGSGEGQAIDKGMAGKLVVCGTQWGDEGKGKIVHCLAKDADVVVRFHGGSNAGHTVVHRGSEFKLSTIPCGILYPHTLNIIGCGVALDMEQCLQEIAALRAKGVSITSENLRIADNALLVLPIHKAMDRALEKRRGAYKIGTTGRGIGVCYEDQIGRRGLRLADVLDLPHTRDVLAQLLVHHSSYGHGCENADLDALIQLLTSQVDQLRQFIHPGFEVMRYCDAQKNVLFEGAQGFWLDVCHGTYPYVTSSTVLSGQVFGGTPVPFGSVQEVAGVAKAYTTRVGNGPMPTEEKGEIGDAMTARGSEYGTVTERKRRCGWFDVVLVKQALYYLGAKSLILTKLDVLDLFESLKICVEYRHNGEKIDYVPSSRVAQENLEPVYEVLPGWKTKTAGITDEAMLPKEAVHYVKRIEDLVGVRVVLVSTGAESDSIIWWGA